LKVAGTSFSVFFQKNGQQAVTLSSLAAPALTERI
jgi:hypothetical protein